MIYLIGGAPRSGKTLLAKKLVATLGARHVALDDMRQLLEQTDPEMSIKNGNDAELNAGRMWDSIKALIEKEVQQGGDCVIDGSDLEPLLVHELLDDPNVRIVFLGYSSTSVDYKIAAIKAHHEGNDWVLSMDEGQLEKMISEEITRSLRFQAQCHQYGIKYIDTGVDFVAKLDEALEYLVATQ